MELNSLKILAIRVVQKNVNLWKPVLIDLDRNGVETLENTFAKDMLLDEGMCLQDVLDYK